MFLYLLVKAFLALRSGLQILTSRENGHMFDYCKRYHNFFFHFFYVHILDSHYGILDKGFLATLGTFYNGFFYIFHIVHDFNYIRCGWWGRGRSGPDHFRNGNIFLKLIRYLHNFRNFGFFFIELYFKGLPCHEQYRSKSYHKIETAVASNFCVWVLFWFHDFYYLTMLKVTCLNIRKYDNNQVYRKLVEN